MDPANESLAECRCRRDGWAPERRRQFLEWLAAGWDVRRACARSGMSREGVYRLRRRDPAFARAWDQGVRTARKAADEAFRALLPEKLRRTLSQLSRACELHADRNSSLDRVPCVPGV